MRCNERRRYSLAKPCQSRSTPCRVPHSASTATRPECQSRIVPPVSKASTLTSRIPGSSDRAAHARSRHHEIADDQLETLVVARLQCLTQSMDRSTDRGLVPEPVAELAARWLGGS